MYCPECLVEYREGFTQCSDCRVPLRPGAPPRELEPDPNLEIVPVLECSDPIIVAAARGALEEAGIPFFVNSEEMGARIGPVTPMIHPWCRFLVSQDRAAEARALVEPLEQPAEQPAADPNLEIVVVLECGDSIALALAKASLEEAGIPYFVQSDDVAVRNVCEPHTHVRSRILVTRDREAEACALLEVLEK